MKPKGLLPHIQQPTTSYVYQNCSTVLRKEDIINFFSEELYMQQWSHRTESTKNLYDLHDAHCGDPCLLPATLLPSPPLLLLDQNYTMASSGGADDPGASCV